MDLPRRVKLNQRLLAGTAVLGLGAVASGAIGGAVAGGVSSVVLSMIADNLGALGKNLRQSQSVLRNEDLAKAAGRTVGNTLRETISPQYPEIRGSLNDLADRIEDYWVEWAEQAQDLNIFASVQEQHLHKLFATSPETFTETSVLEDKADWRELVTWLFDRWSRDRSPYDNEIMPVENYADVIDALAAELHRNFSKNLRQVLKDDAKNGGEAFAGMLLDLHSATLAKIDEIREKLPQLANKDDICQLLQNDLRQTRSSERIEDKLDRVISGESTTEERLRPEVGPLFNVPSLPSQFLPRPDEIEAIKTKLLGMENQTLVMTGASRRVGVQGMGGIGKSVLAAAVAQDESVRRRFPDGVIWLSLGQEPALKTRQVDVAFALTQSRPFYEDLQQGMADLRTRLADKACLLVLDDVWQMDHAAAFDVLGSDCQCLLTTRDAGLVTGLAAQGHQVDLLSEGQALALLATGSGMHLEALPEIAKDVARECGYLPLALAVIGAMVAGMVAGQPLDRWGNVLHKLQTADLEKLAQQFPNYPYPDLLKTLQVSVDALSAEDQQRYLDFAIFPEDTPIPEAVLQIFWRGEELNFYAVQDVVNRLVQLSLAQRTDQGELTLHDLQRDYVRAQRGALEPHHDRFLAAYQQRYPQGYASADDDGYIFEHLIGQHLQHHPDQIQALLGDFEWLQAKLNATTVESLLQDFQSVDEPFLNRLERTLRLSAHVLSQDQQQLASQLWGRLLEPETMQLSQYQYFWQTIPGVGKFLPKYQADSPLENLQIPGISQFLSVPPPEEGPTEQLLRQAQACQKQPWFRPKFPCLDSPDGALIRTLSGHSSTINSVAIAPDGKQVVSASFDNTLKVWDLYSGSLLRTLEGHSDDINSVAITPDGKQVVSASLDRTLKVWDLHNGSLLRTLEGHRYSVNSVAIAPDGKQIVSTSFDNTLKVWDLDSGSLLRTLKGHSDDVNSVAIAPDGKQVVSASWNKTLKVWDLQSYRELRTLEGHGASVRSVAISPDGKQVVSGSSDQTLKVWDLDSGNELHTLEGHSDRVNSVAISPDGRYVISGSDDNTLKVWDLHSGSLLHTLKGHINWVTSVAIVPDGKHVVSASFDNTLKVWDLDSGSEPRTLERHRGWITSVAIVPDGRYVISGSDDKTLKVWDLDSGRELRTLKGHINWVTSVAIALDGKYVVSASFDKTLKVWDLDSGRELRTLKGHCNSVNSVAIAPDGKHVISGSGDRTLKVWDLDSGRELRTLEGHSDRVWSVAITPNGKQVISASSDNTLKVWDLHSGRELRTLKGHRNSVNSVAIAPGGKQVISASFDNTLKVWDLHSGRERFTLEGHSAGVPSVAIASDGKQVVSASYDKTLKVWDLHSGRELASFTADAELNSCTIALDGVTVVAGDSGGRVLFLQLENL